jgi:hypothetical protein
VLVDYLLANVLSPHDGPYHNRLSVAAGCSVLDCAGRAAEPLTQLIQQRPERGLLWPSSADLQYQLWIRGWDQGGLAREYRIR